jgi:uncharacterized membrane protein
MTAYAPLSLADLTFQSPAFGWLECLALAAGVAGVVFAYTAGLRRTTQGPPARFGLLALRLGAIVCLFVALWHPACVRQETLAQRPTLAVVLDDSASMAQPDAGAAVTRYQHAVETLKQRLAPALRRTHELQLFDVEARGLKLDDLPRTAEGARSPLTDTLLRVQQELRDRPLAGIVLLSDGREVSDRPTSGSLEQLHVPVHAIQIAAPSPTAGTPNIAIQSVAANRRAIVGNTVSVAVDLAATGLSGAASVPVSILSAERTVATRTIEWPAGQSTLRAEVAFIPRRPGELTYVVQVGGAPGETDLADNRQSFPLTVHAKPLTVMYVDGVLRWEGKFLREALSDDPDLNVISTVRTAPPGSDRGSQGLLLPEHLANVDVVIIGDVEAAFFSSSEIDGLRKWVTEGGGALVLTGGYHSFGPDGFGRTPLRDVLPVEFSADPNPQTDEPFNLKLTDAGREHPIFHLTGDRVRDAAFFQSLPPLAGCSRVAGVKPGATVLAVNPRATATDGAGARVSPPSDLPVLVVQEVGAGRTLVFAVDTTWRWRMVVGGFTGDSSFYPQFWGQLIRWTKTDERESPPRLAVATDRAHYKPGQTVEVNIALRPPENAPTGATAVSAVSASAPATTPGRYKVTATALTESGERLSVPLAELDAARFRGSLAVRSPGRLDLLVRAAPLAAAGQGADEMQELSAISTVTVERPDLELLDPRPDPQWLAQMAQLSGGRCVSPDQIEAWAAALPANPAPVTRLASSGAAGDRVLAAMFLALLCTEWILRRRSRLA